MRLASLLIQVGAAGDSPIAEKQIEFHTAVARILRGRVGLTRVGFPSSIAVNHHQAVYETNILPRHLLDRLECSRNTNSQPLDLCLLDFCTTPFFVLREPLLLSLATGIVESYEKDLCREFVLLLPKMPGKSCAFRRKLNHLKDLLPNKEYSARLISNDGLMVSYLSTGAEDGDVGTEYAVQMALAYGDCRTRIEKKCVRRLGHFRFFSSKDRTTKCRRFSYHLHDCGLELSQFFQQWWETSNCRAQAILYDLKNSDLLREVVIAHATRSDITAERIVDVLQKETLARAVQQAGPALLVLDAIDTGDTLRACLKTRFSDVSVQGRDDGASD